MSVRHYVLLYVAICLSSALWGAQTLDLISGLNSGQLWAEFRGAGDRAVTGVIGRTIDAPLDVTVPAGTMFLAQAGGRQGQTTIGPRTFGLRETKIAQITLHTACTNIHLPAPTPQDIMIPVGPEPRLARLLSLPGIETQPHAAIQAAVWAIMNNASASRVRQALRREPGIHTAEQMAAILGLAADLLRQGGMEPQQFRLFR